jgi:cellulose synthase/poly-beta-1,6-N-acetylglucosamine synthase-like glycosyltransferase
MTGAGTGVGAESGGAGGRPGSRPAVSVVVPFAGTSAEAGAVIAMLGSLRTAPGDELILSDNSVIPAALAESRHSGGEIHRYGGFLPQSDDSASAATRVKVVRATKEGSPSHARNVGAAHAHNDWLLFLDSDVQPPPDLIELFFSAPIDEQVGAMTGDIAGIPDTHTLAARYGTARNFLGQRSHVMNPFRPRASSANLLVRRAAFDQIHGYTEGISAAEDTDLTWRLHDHGWTLAFNERAVVQHAYRDSLRALGKQWRGYAAGAMWLSQQYPDFKLDPGLDRMVRRMLKRVGIGPGVAFRADGRGSEASKQLTRWQRLQFLFVDCMLGVEEKIGHHKANHVERREP